jgi:hypothetical protein
MNLWMAARTWAAVLAKGREHTRASDLVAKSVSFL